MVSSGERAGVSKVFRFTVLVGSAAALTATGPRDAAAQAPSVGQAVQQAQAGGASISFNIPAQPLAQALTLFGRQSGLQIAVNAAAIAGKSTGGVTGVMSAESALQQLLAGSGVTYRFTSPTSVTVAAPAPDASGSIHLDPVQVQGTFPVPQQAMIDNLPPPYAGGQVATGGQLGLLGNRSVMDTPFNQSSYTNKKAQDQQAKTIKDMLVDDPSVRSMRSDNTVGGDQVSIRGFPVDSVGFSYGGLFGMLPSSSPMVELAERVEVLKGPSAMLNGMPPNGYIGGTINIVPKRAPDEPLTQATANYISAGQVGGHIDFARRFGPDKEVGVRFNGVFRAGQTELQYNSDQRALAVLGLDFRGERVRLSADLGYQNQYVIGTVPYFDLAAGVPLPWAPNARSNPTAQPWGYNQRKDLFGVARAEVDLAENVTAYAALGAHDNRYLALFSNSTTITSVDGTASAGPPLNLSNYTTYFTADAGVRALARTGPIDHQFALTAATYSQTGGLGFAFDAPFATNIYAPTLVARPNIATPSSNKTSNQTLSSIGFADTLSAADKRIQLTVGARLQQVQATNFDITSGAATSFYDQSALSPSVALVFKPWQNVSVYGNFIQGLQQGTIADATYANVGEVFPPFKSTQFEVGVKVDWGKFTTTVSAFQISQPSLIAVPGPLLPTLTLAGEQRNQGLEFNFFGEPTEGVRLLGGLMLLSPVLAKTPGGTTDGWIAPFSPTVQFNVAGEWDLPFVPGLTVNGRVVYTGSQYIDTAWPRRSLPEWTRFDLGLRYAFENPGAKGKLLVARFNVDNVLDANYWAGGSPSALYLGLPRTFRLSLTADF